MTLPARKPDWLRVRLPAGPQQDEFRTLKSRFKGRGLHTVCEEARCPNIFECWGQGTATVMILGETCTRGCRFCSVNTGKPGGVVDPNEPENTALSLAEMGLAYVVLTMVDRDDLGDGGAAHVAKTVQRIKHHSSELRVETLVGDFRGNHEDVRTVVRDGSPDVFAHNVEVVPRLQRTIRDARCSWDRSVDVLAAAKELGSSITKTRAPLARARAISTSCRVASGSRPTKVRASSDNPTLPSATRARASSRLRVRHMPGLPSARLSLIDMLSTSESSWWITAMPSRRASTGWPKRVGRPAMRSSPSKSS